MIRFRSGAFFSIATLMLSACASIPKETVELSYQMGGDLQAVHEGYIKLIHERYDSFRAQRLDYLTQEWEPQFIANWVQDGHLVDVASGRLSWSTQQRKFVPPPLGADKQALLLSSVDLWSKTALKKIDQKRHSLLDPLDAQEKALTDNVNESFDRLYRENAAITVELNSLRKVQDVQDELLADAHAKGMRDQLDTLLTRASEKASQGLDAIKKADSLGNTAAAKIHALSH